MSTDNRIDPNNVQQLSHVRAAAITLSCSPQVIHNPSMDQLYQMAVEQPTCIKTDVPMADAVHLGLSEGSDRVLVSYTGQDTARSAWARLIAPQPIEVERHPELLDTKDRIDRLVREVNFQLMHKDLVHTQVFFSKNKDFMGKVNMIVPKEYAKLAFDLNLNFVRVNEETKALNENSKQLNNPDIWLVCHPDWVNPSWSAWRHRVAPTDGKKVAKDPEPKRIMMIFDIANYTAYLLGARYFGEVKKACLTMIWDMAIKSKLGMPIHGSSKTLYVLDVEAEMERMAAEEEAKKAQEKPKKTKKSSAKSKKSTKKKAKPAEKEVVKPKNGVIKSEEPPIKPVTFITIGLSGSGKSTIGTNPHHDFLDNSKGEGIRIGNDDALVILYDPADKSSGVVGLEDGCYNKSNDYTPGSFYIRTVQSAENVMVAPDGEGGRAIIHQDVLNGNGRVQTARHMLDGADHNLDTPHPDFIALLMKDETLPPLVRINDPHLLISMYMCLASRSTSAENIPVDQMGRLRMIPGANPFNTWGLQQEAESLEEMFKCIGCEGIILNTGGFYIDKEHNDQGIVSDIPKELSLSIYPMLAHKKIEWVQWPYLPGAEIPAPGVFEALYPGYEKIFNPMNIEDSLNYCELLRMRVLERLRFLVMNTKIDRRYVLPLRKAIYQLDTYDLQRRDDQETLVDNFDTLMDTGRELISL